MSEELKSCPFCGGKAEMSQPGTRHQSCIVECGNCGCRLESGDEGDRSGASWNRRAAPIVPQGWKLVPMEPTPEMVRAYLNANNAYWVRVDEAPPIIGKWRNGTPSEATAESYRAMLAASPAPAADGVETNDGGRDA